MTNDDRINDLDTCGRPPRKPYNASEWAILTKPEKRVISFGLYGGERRYVIGIYRNLELAPQVYPGWVVRIYHDDTVPEHDLKRFKRMGAELISQPRHSGIQGMFWRFKVADDPTVDRYIVRDSDSRIGSREAGAVEEWILSGKGFHLLRDHPSHSSWAISGGIWGGTKDPNLKLEEHFKGRPQHGYVQDMEFLRDYLYPYIKNNHIAHDAFSCTACNTNDKNCKGKFDHSYGFPTPRRGSDHIGGRFDEFELGNVGDIEILLRSPAAPACTPCYVDKA